jgi:hypothetical protein
MLDRLRYEVLAGTFPIRRPTRIWQGPRTRLSEQLSSAWEFSLLSHSEKPHFVRRFLDNLRSRQSARFSSIVFSCAAYGGLQVTKPLQLSCYCAAGSGV